jgi:hypothetical protein
METLDIVMIVFVVIVAVSSAIGFFKSYKDK